MPISRKTTSATAAELTIGGSMPSATSRVVIPANMALNIDIQVLAIEDGAANCAKWDLECLVLNSGGTMSIAGPSGAQAPDRTLGSPGSWTVELKVDDTNDSFVVEVVGEAATNIHWRAILRCAEAQYA